MIVHKITPGFVIQVFDSESNSFISQSFVASDQVDYEDDEGNPTDVEVREYMSFDMVQPKE